MNISTAVFGINSVDFLMLAVIVLVVYIRRKDGIVAELFKTFGIFCAVFITLHYYARFADLLRAQFFGKEVAAEFFAFCLLFSVCFLAFVLISGGWSLILQIKSFEAVDRWGNRVLSLVRGYLICSIIFLALILSGKDFFVTRARKSASSAVFSGAAVELYRVSYSNLVEKFFPGEKINKAVFKLIAKESEKTKSLH